MSLNLTSSDSEDETPKKSKRELIDNFHPTSDNPWIQWLKYIKGEDVSREQSCEWYAEWKQENGEERKAAIKKEKHAARAAAKSRDESPEHRHHRRRRRSRSRSPSKRSGKTVDGRDRMKKRLVRKFGFVLDGDSAWNQWVQYTKDIDMSPEFMKETFGLWRERMELVKKQKRAAKEDRREYSDSSDYTSGDSEPETVIAPKEPIVPKAKAAAAASSSAAAAPAPKSKREKKPTSEWNQFVKDHMKDADIQAHPLKERMTALAKKRRALLAGDAPKVESE